MAIQAGGEDGKDEAVRCHGSRMWHLVANDTGPGDPAVYHDRRTWPEASSRSCA